MEAIYNYKVSFVDKDGIMRSLNLHAHTKFHAIELAYNRKQHLQPDRQSYNANKVILPGTRV